MANGSGSYLCGLIRCSGSRSTPTPTRDDDGLRGVEFSPRSSMVSSTRASVPASAPALAASSSAQTTAPAVNLNNPEIAGYFSPPAPRPLPQPDPLRDVRGFYAPEPVAAVQSNTRPWNARYT
ncbi:hypothetical protein M434DRAFT_231157 [Hypoxylon sp. CO27-5]|nr:hypothetical protein M434DRAFT_231157 [Hypoxylon sp. CO27-5]